MVSPGFRNKGGIRPMPTPAGVPVARTSPGWRVMADDMVAMRDGMGNISCVREDS